MIIATNAFEHMIDVDLAISEIARILRPNGHLFATVPFLMGIHQEPHDYARYTTYKLRELLQQNGLDSEIKPVGTVLELIHHTTKGITNQFFGTRQYYQARVARLFIDFVAYLMPNTQLPKMPLGYIVTAKKIQKSPQ